MRNSGLAFRAIRRIHRAMIVILYLMLVPLVPGPALAGEEQVTFRQDDIILSASHYLPEPGQKIRGVILFVHGDGAMPRDAHGYYDPLRQHLHNKGFATFSWDKPGIGGSTGNWLQQSMQDRQREVLSAIAFLKDRYGYKPGQIGLMGFSQAGWVIPAVAKNNPDIGFLIGAGFAINWMQQSWYMTKTGLHRAVRDNPEREQELDDVLTLAQDRHHADHAFLRSHPSYDDYLNRLVPGQEVMTRDRFAFVMKNFHADARQSLTGLTQPFLVLLGQEDQNVDVKDTRSVMQDIFANQHNLSLHMLPGASHALLKADIFRDPNPGLLTLMRLLWMGEDAFAPGVKPVLVDWLRALPR